METQKSEIARWSGRNTLKNLIKSFKSWVVDPFGNKKLDAKIAHIQSVLKSFTDDELMGLGTVLEELDYIQTECWYVEIAKRWLEPKIKEKLAKKNEENACIPPDNQAH